ncbi:MAG TPA: PepSY domain-containing protein [Verrucomicrobiae bacterium]|nr:PepSY domain-containing protein [Verrucomicrobiae bacterium]
MKITHLMGITLSAALLAGCCSEHHKESKEAKQARWMAEAKVSQADAQATAMAQVPNGTIKESELEKEHGKLIWSFDMTTPGAMDTTEINVDALTGKVVSIEKEKPEDEAKEAAKEAKEKKDSD